MGDASDILELKLKLKLKEKYEELAGVLEGHDEDVNLDTLIGKSEVIVALFSELFNLESRLKRYFETQQQKEQEHEQRKQIEEKIEELRRKNEKNLKEKIEYIIEYFKNSNNLTGYDNERIYDNLINRETYYKLINKEGNNIFYNENDKKLYYGETIVSRGKDNRISYNTKGIVDENLKEPHLTLLDDKYYDILLKVEGENILSIEQQQPQQQQEQQQQEQQQQQQRERQQQQRERQQQQRERQQQEREQQQQQQEQRQRQQEQRQQEQQERQRQQEQQQQEQQQQQQQQREPPSQSVKTGQSIFETARKAVANTLRNAAVEIGTTQTKIEEYTKKLKTDNQPSAGGGKKTTYRLNGEKVVLLHKNKKVQRSIYVKDKGKTKYCKIDKEYVLLSKVKNKIQ